MELLISRYGEEGRDNIIKCDENGRKIWSDTVESPSFFALSKSGKYLFAGTEADNYSYIHSYIKCDNGFKRVDSAKFEGTALCHVCFSEKNMMVFGACWGSGHLLYATVDENGKFIKTASIFQKNETGDNDLITRVHFVCINKAEDTLIANNVGLDIIYFYSIENGELKEKDRIYTERDQHPRHSVFTSDEKTMYVITELSNEILVYSMPEKKLIQRITTLPKDFVGKSHCSAICLSPDEKTVYGANRYSESLVFFGVNDDRTLYEKLRVDTEGVKVRHMELSNDGKKLLICYQVSGEICIMDLGDDGLPISGASHRFDFADAADIIEL